MGAKGLPIVETSLRDFASDPVACMTRLKAEHGDLFAIRDGQQEVVFALHPTFNHELLSQPEIFHSRFFAVRGPRRSAQRRLSCGLLSMNGTEHAEQRRVVKGAFSRHAISNYQNVVSQLTDDMLSEFRPGQTRDLSADMTHLLLKITSSILFGMQSPRLAFRLGEMIHHWVELNHELSADAFMSEGTASSRYEELLSYAEEVDTGIREMIAQRRASPEAQDDLLSLLLQAHTAGEGLTEDQMIGQAALLFAAAHMTTAHTLLWTLTLLAQHPEISRRLDDELDAPPTVTDGATLAQAQSFLDRVLRESMRILPASAYSQRFAEAPVTIGTANVPAGCPIIFSQFMTHRIASIYAKPKQFDPDRWLSIKPSPYEYLPFGAGPRLCLGAPLAQSILRGVIPQILRRYRLNAVPHTNITARVVSTMLTPQGAVPMTVAPAHSSGQTVPLQGNLSELIDFPNSLVVRERLAG